MKKQPYSYSFLRYYHEPVSREFANIGVVVWAPESRTLLFRGSDRYGRLSQFFGDFYREDYRQMMKRIDTSFRRLKEEVVESSVSLLYTDFPQSARELALKIIPEDSAALRWGKSGGGLCDSPEQELEDIFQQYIARHYHSQESERRDEATVYREIYRPVFCREAIQKRIQAKEIVAPLARHQFEQAWKNGQWNVYQTLSFDLVKAEDIRNKAYRWHGESQLLQASQEAHRLHFLLGEPRESRHERAVGDAKKILASLPCVQLVEENEVNDFATSLEQEMLTAD